jgi:Ser/Thr protein kinase RdoA (MazF antagonist)
MISPDDIKNICDQYNLGMVISIDAVTEGVLNDNYIITTDVGKYFIKSVREKARNKLAEICDVENFMKSHGIPAITMLKTKSGEICITGKSELFTLYDYVESDRSHIYSIEDYRNMGVMLARIHQVGGQQIPGSLKIKDFTRPSPETITSRLVDYRKVILEKTDADETDSLMLKYIDFKIAAMPQIGAVGLPNDTLTHGDYQTGNILIDPTSRKIIGICDWEKAEFAPRAYEIARSILYICFDETSGLDKALRQMNEFLVGYHTLCSIDEGELIDGIKMRIAKMVSSAWIEDMYYNLHSNRANHFIENEMRIIKLAINGDLYKELE